MPKPSVTSRNTCSSDLVYSHCKPGDTYYTKSGRQCRVPLNPLPLLWEDSDSEEDEDFVPANSPC